jgi:hypothetical protein
VSGEKRRGGWSNPASAANGRKAADSPDSGRPPTKAEIREGDGILLSQVYADGGFVDLGRGTARIERRGRSRIVVVPQADGSEIRIVIPH